MNWNEYTSQFSEILEGKNTTAPYDNPAYLEYVKLNNSRMNRWLKKGELSDETKQALDKIKSKQKWILITEPWCGDAAHLAPFIEKIAAYSPHIDLEIQLRDSKESEINNYLTNGGKAIPKLIARDANNNDLFVWGARPKEATELVQRQKMSEGSAEEKKAELQVWYNKDKGISIQKELSSLLS